MAVLVISGSGRRSGKTAVGCALVRAMPELRWVAVKLTAHEHGTGAGVWEETNRDSEKDTGRYLKAGAARSFIAAGAPDGDPDWALDWLSKVHLPQTDGLVLESNQSSLDVIVGAGEKFLRLAVLGSLVEDWKQSLWESVDEADALVLTGGFPVEKLPCKLQNKRIFWMVRGEWISQELAVFARSRLV